MLTKIMINGEWVDENEANKRVKILTKGERKFLSALNALKQPSSIKKISERAGMGTVYCYIVAKSAEKKGYVKKFGGRGALYGLTEEGFNALKMDSPELISSS